MARGKADVSLEDLREKLRGAGLRATAPRLAVLRSLFAASSPISHPELAEALAAEGWDRATIYRNLIDLTQVGIVRRTDLGDHVWRFELLRETGGTHPSGAHPHFVCDQCGDVQCLPDQIIEIHPTKSAPRSLRRASGIEVQLKGRCDNCN
jgi:Fur family ferric uptake transcriptional regulator